MTCVLMPMRYGSSSALVYLAMHRLGRPARVHDSHVAVFSDRRVYLLSWTLLELLALFELDRLGKKPPPVLD